LPASTGRNTADNINGKSNRIQIGIEILVFIKDDSNSEFRL
jgi:hypothetical protein